MANHHRGLWGYTGSTPAGRKLTIQSTGIGAASAAVVLGELAGHGVRRAIRVGTCVARPGGPPPGAIVIASGAVAAEGASRALGAGARTEPDPGLNEALLRTSAGAAAPALVASLDVVSAVPALAGLAGSDHDGAAAVEMGTATLFALGARLGLAVASGLVVARSGEAGEALAEAELERLSLELGRLAVLALGG